MFARVLQSILTLVNIRRTHHLFPLRPYLPNLVGALEDSDSTVRETTRTSIVELFTGPGVTDAARSDLKKEMTKKNVRKTIIDDVLAKVLGAGSTPVSEGSENGDAPGGKKEYVPPSLALQGRRPTTSSDSGAGPSISRAVSHGNVKEMSRPGSRTGNRVVTSPPPMPSNEGSSDVQPVYIASARDLETEFAEMFKPFEGKETEHNWAARERAIIRIRGMLKGDVHVRYAETFLAHLKPIADASIKTLLSLRTIVATNTCSLYNDMALTLGPAMDPICETLYLHLLRMAGFTKKITAQTSQATVATIITHTSAHPRTLLPLLWTTLQDKIVPARSYAIEHLKHYLDQHALRAKNNIESSGMLDTLDKCIRKALADVNVSVRQNARPCFWSYYAVWPERGQMILEAQDNILRKQLEKTCPDPQALSTVPVPAPTTKKSSVAAAIAASRAKAKAIASAPPTLRHQATSAARNVTTTPPKRSSSPSVSTGRSNGDRASSPLSRSSASPPSPRSRIVSNPMPPKPAPSARVPSASHSRTSSNDSANSASQAERRRAGSPLIPPSPPRGSVLRRAMQTALPSSPPATTVTPPSPMPPRQAAAANRQHVRSSVLMPELDGEEESLLTAVHIPLPEDSDSDMDMDDSVNLISFSTPYEKYPPAPQSHSNSRTNSFSPRSSGSKPGLSNTLSTSSPPAGVPQPIVEDALRARAEQAESAAERLLELVEPEDETLQQPPIRGSLLLSNGGSAARTAAPPSPSPVRPLTTVVRPPMTPANKKSAVWRQVASFQDSPAYNGGASSLMTDVLKSVPPKNDSMWWRKRMALVTERRMFRDGDPSGRAGELQEYISALEQGVADVSTLKNIALFCINHASVDSISPLSSTLSMPASPSPFIAAAMSLQSLKSDVWSENKSFDRLWTSLKAFLTPERAKLLVYGLIVLWEMLEYQTLQMEGRDTDVFAILLHVRYSGKQQIMEATNFIRDALTSRVEAVYGLMTMHAILQAFRLEPPPPPSSADAKAGTYAYGLIALGKFILRLPAEILEEELPRLKATLTSALNDSSSLVVRESAAAVIIAAQLGLRDEAHLFTLLDGLPDEKKNLLTYLFDKHGARGSAESPASADRLEREMRRLDGRTSTPPRPTAA
ncbi:hypothetical protein EWM64_g3741 [Hericium alpestre]|uniref:CLASP N-terminal domain-containing protein n=1 Tax=Hericium alpestre TaxID=135208 RepID=A0A4Z0A238_9AGAM|nr:hypothetical protein EWM64_g3741 [Hericium alpestre]